MRHPKLNSYLNNRKMFFSIFFLFWIFLFRAASGQFDANFTLQNIWGRLPQLNLRSMIHCVSSDGNTNGIKFSRKVNTGQGIKLPKRSQQFVQGRPVFARIFLMPDADKLDRFGAFQCRINRGGVPTEIVTLKLPPDGVVELDAASPYITANKGDDVELEVVVQKKLEHTLKWRHNGGDEIAEWDDKLKVELTNVQVSNAGVYECYYEGRRNESLHAILRLIVRACPTDFYGDDCESKCPPCYNGGICHDKWGVCVCPAGFTGENCEKACGGNHFGTDCSKQCTPLQESVSADGGCAFHLFCKPDPYGCSCAPGFKGGKCMDHCEPGWYGADCKQRCHCFHGQRSCNRITGACSGGCLAGWRGESCQIEGCQKDSYMSKSESCQECPPNSHTAGEGKESLDDCTCDSGYTGNPSQGIPCTGCQKDSYMSKSGSCQECPPNSHTAGEGKTSLHDCTCDSGYTGNPSQGIPCTDMECTEKNGSCSNICKNFPGIYMWSCEVGYRLDFTQKICSDATSVPVAVSHHARLLCRPFKERGNNISSATAEFPCNTICVFGCREEYKLSFLAERISCSESGSWKETVPECFAMICPSIEVPKHGTVEPSSCATHGGEILEKCYFKCNPGFHLVGDPVFTCQGTRFWKPEKYPSCEPILPDVTCLPDITVQLPKGEDAMEVEILQPESNVDLDHITVLPSWVKYGRVIFPAGTTDVVYMAKSTTAPNVTFCTRKVQIIDAEPPTVVYCPPLFSEIDPDGKSLITWEEPQFEDNVGVVSVIKTTEPNVSLNPGLHFVQYTAKDAAGNVAECIFHIIVPVKNRPIAECKDPIGPLNGISNCSDWIFGKLCKPECHSGYVFYFKKPIFYACDNSGLWSPTNRIQNCTRFFPSFDSFCFPGMEFRIDDNTKDEICVECPSSMSWSSVTKTCVEAHTPVHDNGD